MLKKILQARRPQTTERRVLEVRGGWKYRGQHRMEKFVEHGGEVIFTHLLKEPYTVTIFIPAYKIAKPN